MVRRAEGEGGAVDRAAERWAQAWVHVGTGGRRGLRAV